MDETSKKMPRTRGRRKVMSLEDVRGQLAKLLPALIHNATQSYEAFSQVDTPADAKGFAAHHSACKAALSHVEVMTKLVKWAQGEEEAISPSLSEDEEIAGLLAGARAALQELEC